ncbi:MAG: hypothetical protein LBJ91_02615 [Clostridiales Family XIII bacterium]|jgi:hypothetical protein|nr:hypothetical protein [Clostridiales Family XIII bacterium]
MVIPSKMREKQRAAIESLYEDTCKVTVTAYTKDPVTKKEVPHDDVVVEGQPCRLSFSSVAVTSAEDSTAVVVQAAKLFVSPDVDIPPGSHVMVMRPGGAVYHYKMSGLPASRPSCQVIPLVADEGRA